MQTIAVLEDDPRRSIAMQERFRVAFPGAELRLFVSASEMISWLSEQNDTVRLVSLDCDLDVTALKDEHCGSGEDVVAFLVRNLPSFPVLIHSSNAMRAPAMHMELAMAGCAKVVLCPFKDAETWLTDMKHALG